ncbi:MAG: RNA polymerase sigma factor [Planctomycetota bacterium]
MPESEDRTAAWLRDHLDAVYRYVRRRLGTARAAEAEDVTQEAFLALFRAESAGRGPDDAGAYLFGAARRRVADLHRRDARGLTAVTLPDGWERYADDPLPATVLERASLRELVQVVLGLLPGTWRRLLDARYRDGTPLADLATRYGVTAKAIENRLRRARRAFRERFLVVGRDWIGDGEGAS